jgi:tetratricopeptide (TPR) repeat protein
MELAAEVLAKVPCALVLDNFEDVLEETAEGWRIADGALAAFYSRAQTQLTRREGGRVVVTSRYLPAATREAVPTVSIIEGLRDFEDYEFFKLLKRDRTVAARIGAGELPRALLRRLYTFAGGTPRFLERVRTLLKTLAADELEAALNAGGGVLEKERDDYLEKHFGPKLFAGLTQDARLLVGRLGVSELFLPEDALASLTGLAEAERRAVIRRAVDSGLLQVLEETGAPTLYLPPGVWRGWLTRQLAEQERQAAHGVLAVFWREALEKDRVSEMRVGIDVGLQGCLGHARRAGNFELWRWASVRLSRRWERIAEWRAARGLLEEIPVQQRDGPVWQSLATIDMNEGKYAEAREKFARSLDMLQIGDRAGEASTLQGLASIDMNEGKYAEARDKFTRSLDMRQQIGDRAGEANTWHQLASIDLNDGKYAEAREKFARSLVITQQIGDRVGEAATWHQLASIDVLEGKHAEARQKFDRSLDMRQQIGDRVGEAATWHQLASIDLRERKYTEARQKFARSLEIKQQIGDRVGEAATFHQLGFAAWEQSPSVAAAKLVGLCFLIDHSIGHGDAQQDQKNFLGMCGKLGLSQPQVHALLQEIAASYRRDHGTALVREAFPD